MNRSFRQLLWRLRRKKREAELREEMAFHLEGDAEEREAAGAPSEEARLAALREFGNVTGVREKTRSAWGWRFVDDLVQDLKYAVRTMRRSWGFAALAVGSLALGIGANTALFSVARNALFADLPLPDADELVTFQWVGPNDVRGSGRNYGFTVVDSEGPAGSEFSLSAFEQLRLANRTLSGLAAFAPASGLSVRAGIGVDNVDGQYVSGGYYDVMGIPAFRGRVISPEDDTLSAEPVVVLGHDYWERRFNSDPGTVGSVIQVNGLSFTVVGVTPPETPDPVGLVKIRTAPAITMPLVVEARLPKTNQTLSNRPTAWWLLLMGRLRPGVGPSEAAASFRPVFERVVRDEWESYRRSPEASSLDARPTASDDPRIPELRVASGAQGVYGLPTEGVFAIGLVAAIFAIVLLVVCVNLTSLLLSRMTARQEEFAARRALGAGRQRLVRQLLTESLVLALAGGALGVLLTVWSLESLPALLPADGGRAVGFGRMHWTAFGFALLVSLSTVVVFGLGPSLGASRIRVGLGRDHRRRSAGSRLNKALISSEVALSLLLLVSAGLFIRTLENLRSVAIGFNPENVLVFRTDAPLAGYGDEESLVVYDRILEELRSVPGVESAALSGFAPLNGQSRRVNVFLPGDTEAADEIPTLNVHPDYFRTMEIPLLRGRGLTAADGPNAPPVAVVNETFARTLLPGQEDIGSRFGYTSEGSRRIEIVGVVADARFARLRDPAPPVFYTPHAQPGAGSTFRTFEVRTSVDPWGLVSTVWDAVRRVDPRLPFYDASTYREGMERTLAGERVFAAVTTLFGVLTLVLSMTGLFGLMSCKVARQTKEIGIRMALGADRRKVLGAVIRETLTLTGIGLLLGLGAVLAATPLIGSLLFGLAPHDPSTIVSAVVLMVGVAVLAGYLPARRASRVDPMVALRHD
jgi:predicted permease